jgi:hypothetical protein
VPLVLLLLQPLAQQKIQQAHELSDKTAEPLIKSALNQTELHVGEDLDLAALPRGSITRLWVTLVQDSMARPIEIPVMVRLSLLRS